MELEEKSARLIRAEEKVKLANDELEKVKKEEKKRMRKVQDAHKFMMGGNARIALEEAKKALEGARAAFGGGAQDTSNIPAVEMSKEDFDGEGMGLVNLIREIGLVPSNGEGFRTIKQGGLTVQDEKVEDTHKVITLDDFKDGELVIKKGKKKFIKVVLK